MTLSRQQLLIFAVSTALLGVLLYLFFTLFEYYEETVNLGFGPRARQNPYLAAEQYLQQQSINVQSSNEMQVLDELPEDGVLIIQNANSVLSERNAQRAIEWMQRGGQIVVAAQFFNEEQPDVLLSHFDITKHTADDGYAEHYSDINIDDSGFLDEEAAEIEEPDNERVSESSGSDEEEKSISEQLREANEKIQDQFRRQQLEQEAAKNNWSVEEKLRRREALSIEENLLTLEFEGLDYGLRADFSGSGSLSHPYLYQEYEDDYWEYRPFYWAQNDSAIGFMQLNVGDGMLTVMSDVNIFTSSQIGFFDHAMLLQVLVENASEVLFLYGANVPGLFDLLWQNYFELCVVALLLLLFWLIYNMRRFGPLIENIDVPRRSFQEHINAVADFLWRNRITKDLLKATRDDIWLAMQKRHPGFSRLSKQDKVQRLAAAVNIDDQQVLRLMYSKVPDDEIYFFQLVKALQNLRKAL